MNAKPDDKHLLTQWSVGLQASLQASGRPIELRRQLLARVADSARAHERFLTVRRESGPWLPAGRGAEQRQLRQDDHFELALLRLSPGAALPLPQDAQAQELLLIEGQLQPTAGGGAALPARSHAVLAMAPQPEALLAPHGALLLRRLLRVPPEVLPASEAQWWWRSGLKTGSARQAAWLAPGPWRNSGPGAQYQPLSVQAHVASMLVRLSAGTAIADHQHELGEDCLVLQGEMFLGDILLRAGDYQLAPAGAAHLDGISEHGVLFYFHGAVDTSMRSAYGL